MKRRFLAALLAAILSLGLICGLTAQADWDDGIIFTAINYNVLPLTSETMPVQLGGTIYVPYTVFDASLNGVGVSIGLFNGGQDKTKGTYTLYSSDKNLTFDLNNNVVWDYYQVGELQETIPQAIIRNNTIYLPVVAVCRYFGLSTYYTVTSIGYPIIRIKNENYVLEDEQFLSAASSILASRLKDYEASVNPVISPSVTATSPTITTSPSPSVSVSPSVSPSASPSPSASASASISPSPTEEPEPEEEPEADRSQVTTYLAFLCDTGEDGDGILDSLQASDRVAVFFFSTQQLAMQDDLVRRVVAEGHSIGIAVTGTSLAEITQEIETGNQLLETIARTRSRLVLLAEEEISATELTDLGYVCWPETISALPAEGQSAVSASYVLQSNLALAQSLACITLDDSSVSSQVLRQLLALIEEDNYSYGIPLETVLAGLGYLR